MTTTKYAVIQAGQIGTQRWPHTEVGRIAAQAAVDELNAECEEETGETEGDGLASLTEIEDEELIRNGND